MKSLNLCWAPPFSSTPLSSQTAVKIKATLCYFSCEEMMNISLQTLIRGVNLHCGMFTIIRGHITENTRNHKVTVKEELSAPMVTLGRGLYPMCVFISAVYHRRTQEIVCIYWAVIESGLKIFKRNIFIGMCCFVTKRRYCNFCRSHQLYFWLSKVMLMLWLLNVMHLISFSFPVCNCPFFCFVLFYFSFDFWSDTGSYWKDLKLLIC